MPGDPLELATARAWRAWLASHHGAATEAWLVYWKKHTGHPSLSYEDSVDEALCFGWVDGKIRRLDEDRSMRRFSPRRPSSHGSETNEERVARLLAAGKMTDSGMEAVRVARESGRWDAPVPSKRIPCDVVPEELAAALQRRPQAALAYENSSRAQQRRVNAWVGSARRPSTRLRRAEAATEMLADGRRLEM